MNTHRWMTRLVPITLAVAWGCDGAYVHGPVEAEPEGVEPAASVCASRHADLPTAEELVAAGVDIGFVGRTPDPDEEDGGVPLDDAPAELLPAAPSIAPSLHPTWALAGDADGDCLRDVDEPARGLDPKRPDTDGDGWFDGPCNERRRLVLTKITAHDEEEDVGSDELYLIVDDVRFPTTSDLDGYWSFDDDQSRSFSLVVAQRVRGTNTTGALASVRLEGWEDDVEAINTWWADDSLFSATINLGSYYPGQTFTVRKTYDDYDYTLTFRVDVVKFADPHPTTSGGDKDADGIKDAAEHTVSRTLGGIADPWRTEVLVELDWMKGRALETRARRLVTTRLATHGLALHVRPSEELPVDGCLTRTEAKALFDSRFQQKGTKAFRYAVMSEKLWNDASGVAIGDTFFVDDSTWWINGGVLPQAGTFIHELGHTLGLVKSLFHLIDSIGSPFYDSAMNYLYQPSMVDWSDDGAGGTSDDHDDWAAARPAKGLEWSFASSTTADDGVCR
ncbi:MAG: hypothetical protein IT385_08980, partial [Deltaproteobacteria bacterium]|nr:hypothetical protein [Deltaproteobacteria bacterium]